MKREDRLITIVCLMTMVYFIYNVSIKGIVERLQFQDLSQEEIEYLEQTVVNLSIIFFVNIYFYVVFTLFNYRAIKSFNGIVLKAFGVFWSMPIILNILSWNKSWDEYNEITSNHIIDLYSALFLITLLIILLCRKLKVFLC